MIPVNFLTDKDVEKLNTTKGLAALLRKDPLNYRRAIRFVDYEKQLKKLQVELILNDQHATYLQSHFYFFRFHMNIVVSPNLDLPLKCLDNFDKITFHDLVLSKY